MKKIIIKSTLPEDTIISNLKELTNDLRSRKLLQKSDELIDGLEEKDDKSFEISINANLMNPSNYKLISSELKKLGEIISNDLKNFDENGDLIVKTDENEEKEKKEVVNEQSVVPALSLHDKQELLFNVKDMGDIKSLLFSEEELGKTTPQDSEEKKVEEPTKEDPKPEKEPETKEHDSKEEPKPEETPKAEPEKGPEPEKNDPKPEDVKPEEVKPELHDEKEPEAPKSEEPKEELHDSQEAKEIDFDSLYFSAEELQDYRTLLFDIEAEKKAEEEKNKENKEPEKKDPEEPKPAVDKDEKPKEEPKKEELHDEGKPKSGAPEGPVPAKKSLKEVLEDYEKTKKPYTNEAVASEAGVSVEEVAKMKKELGLMDDPKKEEPKAPEAPKAEPEKKDEPKKEGCPIKKEDALKALADLRKKESLGKDLNVVEKFFCDSMKKFFSIEEIENALKHSAPISDGLRTQNKIELIKELNRENNKKRLGTLGNMN